VSLYCLARTDATFFAQFAAFFPQIDFFDLAEERPFEFSSGCHVSSAVMPESFVRQLMPGIQQGRRFPEASMLHTFSIRRLRVSSCLAEIAQRIQSRRAMGVVSPHKANAEGRAKRALRRSVGTLISGSSSTRVISTITVSPMLDPTASRRALLTLSHWLPLPSGSSVARKGKPLIVPSTIVMSGDGSFALAFLGNVSTVHEPIFPFGFGRNNLALNRTVDLVFSNLPRVTFFWTFVGFLDFELPIAFT
jgi:hypothetical protein